MTAGKPIIDWDDEAARDALVDSRAWDGYALLQVLERHEDLPERVGEAAHLLATVVGQDLEPDEGGRLRIARRIAPDRVISTVDPQAGTTTRPATAGSTAARTCARLTHRPSGLVVVATASRSQRQNIMAAFAELQRRLAVAANDASAADRNQCRRTQTATGECPTKQWTWNDQRAEWWTTRPGPDIQMAAFRRGRFTPANRHRS